MRQDSRAVSGVNIKAKEVLGSVGSIPGLRMEFYLME